MKILRDTGLRGSSQAAQGRPRQHLPLTSPRVEKATSANGTVAKATPRSSIVLLPLASRSTLRKLSESQTSDSSPSKAVAERTRRKTDWIGISDAEWIVVHGRMSNMRERLTHVTVGGQVDTIGKRMEDYLAQCKKAMLSGKREDLPKELITKLEEQARERQ